MMDIDVLYRGAQSALFFYLSCAPCAEAAKRRKRRRQAKRDIEEKRALELEEPDLYANHEHMEPYHTNPYWDEEIRLGPHLEKRNGKKNATGNSQKGTATSKESSSEKDFAVTEKDGKLVPIESVAESKGADWNRKRYQRQDEELWGRMDTLSLSAISREVTTASTEEHDGIGTSVDRVGGPGMGTNFTHALMRPGTGRTGRSGTTTSAESCAYLNNYRTHVSDLHPPVVNTPLLQAKDMHWMIQPPPAAKIMSGKERAVSGNTDVRDACQADMLTRCLTGSTGSKISIARKLTKQTLVLDESWGLDDTSPAIRSSMTVPGPVASGATNLAFASQPKHHNRTDSSSDCSSLGGTDRSPSHSFQKFVFPATAASSNLPFDVPISRPNTLEQTPTHLSVTRTKLGSFKSSRNSSLRSATGSKRRNKHNLFLDATNSSSRKNCDTPSPTSTNKRTSHYTSDADDTSDDNSSFNNLRPRSSIRSRRSQTVTAAATIAPAPNRPEHRHPGQEVQGPPARRSKPLAVDAHKQNVGLHPIRILAPSPISKPRNDSEVAKDQMGRADSGTASTENKRPSANADATTLRVLEKLVDPSSLAKSRFVGAPIVEARIGLPDDDSVHSMASAKRWSCEI